MLQITCSTLVCLSQYLGLGVVRYQAPNAVVYSAMGGTYYCQVSGSLYACNKLGVGVSTDY